MGIMGTGIAPSQSAQVTNGGATYQSNFSFTNPSFQIGLGGRLPQLGSIGVLTDIGDEFLPDNQGGGTHFLVLRGGAGALTRYFFNSVSLSATLMATLHFWNQTYIDNNGKLGLRFKIHDDLVLGSLEYTFSFKAGAAESFYQNQSSTNFYEVLKALISVRFFKIAGAIVGFSNDLGEFSDIGKTIHLGVELRPSDVYPYFGGYEIGISTQWSNLIIHRFWIGYCFKKKTQ